jgi:hypothetical protein
MVQVGKYSDGVQADGQTWELVKGTWFAVTKANGRYEAVASTAVGRNNNDWCGSTQYDCPPHGELLRVEVPTEFAGCTSIQMDISWRIHVRNTCGSEVPVRFALRTNDVTRTGNQILEDYLSLAGGLKPPARTGFVSDGGLFAGAEQPGDQVKLTYGADTDTIGYSCWDCLPDSMGTNNPVPVPLVPGTFTTFGTNTQPLGTSLLQGVVFPMARPNGKVQTLNFELSVPSQKAGVVWIGRWDVPVGGFLTPTPTATAKP